MIEDYFSIQIFFIIFRETLETAIIISVLLSFINQRSQPNNLTQDDEQSKKFSSVQNKLKLQVWVGAILGLVICFIIGMIFIASFYIIGNDYWSYAERIWEGVFSLLSSIIITIMGIGLLRINKVMKVKWWIKLGDAYNESEEGVKLTDDLHSRNDDSRLSADSTRPLTASGHKHKHKKGKKFTKKYFLAILPLVTTLREGLEAVVFIGGIGMSSPPTSIPFSIIAGVLFGAVIGCILYKGGNKMSLQYFLILSTCFLYIVSAGLMSRGVWFLELESYVRACGGLDVGETGSGPGSYDIAKSVWHVNCCNGLKDGWWMIFNAIFGWTNSATYGSVGSYIAYWLAVIVWLEVKLYEEREGVAPFIPIKWQLKRIAKKVKLYETRHKQQHGSIESNSNPAQDAYDGLDEREAQAQVLLST